MPFENAPRREGDPPRLVGNAQRARDVLGWEPKRPGPRGDRPLGLGVAEGPPRRVRAPRRMKALPAALGRPWDDGMRWRVALALAAGIITLRALVFVLFEQSYFDADQAVFGLMALHLSEARAFPLYMYGQGYMLAVSVWLAAPFVLALGPTVAALKLPLLGLNLVAAGLLLRGLVRDSRLSPWLALLASLPFVLAPVVPTSRLLEHQGGVIEPFVWILLLWVLRSRPLLLGLVAGLGYENREFTAYGLVALAFVAVLEGRLRHA